MQKTHPITAIVYGGLCLIPTTLFMASGVMFAGAQEKLSRGVSTAALSQNGFIFAGIFGGLTIALFLRFAWARLFFVAGCTLFSLLWMIGTVYGVSLRDSLPEMVLSLILLIPLAGEIWQWRKVRPGVGHGPQTAH